MAITAVNADTKNAPIIDIVITDPTIIEGISTAIVVIGDLGTTGTDMRDKTPTFTNTEDITVKADT